MPEQRNLILAIVLSVTIIIAFQYFYELPRLKEAQRQEAQHTEQTAETAPAEAAPEAAAPAPPGAPAATEVARTQALATTERVAIENARLEGSLALTGGRIDNLVLSDYRETTEPDSPNVRLLNPPGAPDTYFAEFGWVAGDEATAVPGRDATWQADRARDPPGPAGHAHLGQRRESALQPHGRDRRELHVHDHPAGREHRRRAGQSSPLWPDQPLGHAANARLLHPARGADRGARRDARGDRLRRPPRGRPDRAAEPGRLAGHHRQVLAGVAGSRPGKRAGRELSPLYRGGPGPLPGRLPAPGHDRAAGRRPSRLPTVCSPGPRRSGCSTSTPTSTVSRCSIVRSTSAGSTS